MGPRFNIGGIFQSNWQYANNAQLNIFSIGGSQANVQVASNSALLNQQNF